MKFPPVTIATNNGDMGGGEVMLLAIARALTNLGVSVSVVAPSEPSALADAAEAAGMTTERLPAVGRAQWTRALRQWDRKHQPRRGDPGRGILWCNGLVPATATAGHAARIVHLHQAPLSTLQRILVPAARAGAIATLVPSAYMTTTFPGARVLPNWTDAPTTADVAEPSSRLDRADTNGAGERNPTATAIGEHVRPLRPNGGGPFTVGYLGRLSTDKGVVTLVEAMRLLNGREPGRYRLLVAGEPRFVDPADYAVVDAALTSLGGPVDRPGWMDRGEFFDRIDVLAQPSLFEESFGLTAAEAMAAQVPVVVSNRGALPEVVGPGGTIVPADSPVALANALQQVTADIDTDTAAARVNTAYRRWRERFSPAAAERNLATLLGELLVAQR